MRVLMISIGYGMGGLGSRYGYYGGTELGAERLGKYLSANGVDLDVVAAGSPHVRFNIPIRFGMFWKIHWIVSALFRSMVAIKSNPDVIYARYATLPLFIGVLLKFIYSKPLVVSVHGSDMTKNILLDTLIEFLIGHCDVVVCYDNKAHIKKLEDKTSSLVIIPNGIDTDVFVPKKSKDKIKKVVYLGGKRKVKGYNDMITLSRVKGLWRDKKLELHIYGDDSYESCDGVYFHKYASRDKLPDILRKGDLFILPSYSEGVPGALLEAMASGMYVIASDLDFTRDVIDFTYLFKAGDIDKMVEFIDMYESGARGLFHNQVKENIKIVKSKYSMDEVGKKWLKLLNQFSED